MKRLSIFFAALMACMLSFAGTFVKTDLANIKSTDVVIITAKTSDGKVFALSNDKGASNAPTAVAVTVDKDNKIETEATNILWNLSYNATDATFKVNVAGGTTYLYCTNTNNGVRVGTGEEPLFSIKDNYIYHEAYKRYLGVYNQNNWRCYANTTGNIANQTCAFYVQGAAADIPATAIALDKTTATLDKGATVKLTATLTPANATTEVVWTTDNAEVATVANGLVTAVGVGTANITATAGSVSAICAVTVNDVAVVAVESVALNQTTLTIEEKKTATLVATITPNNATNKNVTWKSDAEAVASVENGVVTAVAAGTANITVTTEDGAKTATCAVTVTEAKPVDGMNYSVDFTKAAEAKTWTIDNKEIGSLTEVWSQSASYGYKGSAYVSGKNNAAESWLVSPKLDLSKAEVATMTVNHALNFLNGKANTLMVKGTKDGETWVDLTVNGWPAGNSWTFMNGTIDLTNVISANTQVAFIYKSTTTVAPTWEIKKVTIEGSEAIHATGVSLGMDTLTTELHKYTQLTATLTPEGATDLVTWASDNEKVATVSATGVVTAVSVGSAKITATAGSASATCVVVVAEATPITCAQAVEIAKTVKTNNVAAAGGKYVIRGYVTALVGTPSADMKQYSNYSVWMADTKDGGKVFEAYAVKPIDGTTIAAVGDIVEVIGDITKYNTTYETMGKGTATIQIISMRGDYTIGAKDSCNYASLADAFTAYNTNAAAGLVTGNVNFLVATDLVEPKNVGIQNPTEYTLTLTVDKAEARTISFSQAADNAGPSGNICIGCDMTLTHTSASVESKNIVIDGSFNGSEESYLTIKSVAGCHKLNGPVLIYGNVKNATVKNCQLIAENGAGSSIFPVTIRSQKGTDFAPENITIENNYIEAVKGNSDQGIYFQLTTADMKKPANVTISDNLIKATTRGIFMNGINNATIKDNVIMVNQPGAGLLSYGIWGFGNTEGEFIIEGNNIAQLSTGAAANGYGINGIVAGAGKWYIRNNYVSGFKVANTAADNITLVGIQGSSAADTVVIEHNTVVMPEQANKPANASAAKVCLIKPVTAKASVKNNLLVSNENGFANALVANPAGIMESNVYCTASYVGATEETKDFAAYKTTVEPTAKSVVSVTFEDLANGNLDLVAPSDGDINLGVTRLADVTTDIYGTERGEFTYAGAYQGTAIQPGPGSDVENINANGAEVQKIVRNGQVLIIRDGKTYNMMGQQVE